MLKGDIYELSSWFEGDKSDWIIYIAPDTYETASFFDGNEYRLVGNLFSDSSGVIIRNLQNTTSAELGEALVECYNEECWDDVTALQQIKNLIDHLGAGINEKYQERIEVDAA